MASADDLENLKKTVEGLSKPLELIGESIADMFEMAENLNKSFVQGRTRMDEMADAAANAAAGVIRLGGSATQAAETMAQIAEGSRRNVIATEEQVSKLYAATSILGGSASDMVESFAEVGIETSQIGTNLEESIGYIQSVGLNARTVMADVNTNMSKMNRYQFEGGVQGLAKMAAQASMLRFDMAETFSFAEKVLSPEGAIETAAGLQRLGVTIGNLADPFALMNQSLTDPSGLQDSIIKAAKQFTEFDEKTKSFKINPQGVLTLRELANETGMSFENLSKSALAAADLDKRISAISPNIQFDKEEDKQLLANMATMKGGEYVVQLKNDETGKVEQRKLSDLTQTEFEKLRKQQEEGPKTLEEISISQLGVLENIDASLRSNIAKATFGVASTPVVRENLMGADRIAKSLTLAVDKAVPGSAVIGEKVTSAIDQMRKLFVEKDQGKLSESDFSKKIKDLEDGLTSQAKSLGTQGYDALKDILENTAKGVKGSSGIEKEFKSYANEVLTAVGRPNAAAQAVKEKSQAKPLTEDNFLSKRVSEQVSKQSETTKTTQINAKTDVSGNIKITVDGNVGANGLTQQQLTQIFNSEGFKQYVANLGKDTKGSGVVSYQ